MSVGDYLRKNLHFWHWYPRLLCEGLTEEELHWQPETNPNHIVFALWHAYRSEDEIIHSLLARRQSVCTRDNWAARLPVKEPGNPPYGTGLKRDQIARIRLDLPRFSLTLRPSARRCRSTPTASAKRTARR